VKGMLPPTWMCEDAATSTKPQPETRKHYIQNIIVN